MRGRSLLMISYVTLADVAKAANVSAMTVSLALRRHPRIPETTRIRVEAIAKTLGYQPNALLSSLAAFRHKSDASPYRATIGMISNDSRPGEWKRFYFQKEYWEGAQERGKQLGYVLEEFCLKERGMSHERLSKILVARNISGLLFLPQPRPRSHLKLKWDKFSAVTFGFSLTRPKLHVATVHHADSAMLAVRKLRGHGYRRIGAVGSREVNERVNLGLLGGFLAAQQSRPVREQIPPLVLPKALLTFRTFQNWYSEHRPEVLFLCGLPTEYCLEWIDRLRLSVPGDIGIAAHSVAEGDSIAGIYENSRVVGAKAVEMVKAMIDRGERGLPEVPIRILVEGQWVEGATLRRLNRKDPS